MLPFTQPDSSSPYIGFQHVAPLHAGQYTSAFGFKEGKGGKRIKHFPHVVALPPGMIPQGGFVMV